MCRMNKAIKSEQDFTLIALYYRKKKNRDERKAAS